MAFPTTGVLDNFDRANEDPLSDGGNWAGPLHSGWTSYEVITNQAGDDDLTSAAGSYRTTNFGPDVEAFCTVAVKPPNNKVLWLVGRLQGEGTATEDGYILEIKTVAGADQWRIIRRDNGANTVLGAAATQEVANGDGIGLEIIGSTIKGYHFTGGAWTEIISRTDETYTLAGKIGTAVDSTTTRIDDFGGGTVVVAGGGLSIPVAMASYRRRRAP